ncbi:MAG: hypothetical protein V3T88_07165, partial [Nitrosomonadaceae bacterium]
MARIPITTSLAIDNFSGGVVNVASSSTTNAIFDQYADGRFFATQRPSINIFEDASVTVADTKGRGIYFWNAVGARYFVNDDTVYKGDYSAPLGVTLTSGTDKVYFFEVGPYLVIIDPQNNEGWTILDSASTTLVAITDLDFPPNQTPTLQLARGGAVLNGILYVSATNAEMFNSATEDPTAWATLDFISAEIAPDDSVFVMKHQNHIANFGTRTIEFFYDNANPTASPLNVRTDISHNVGSINFDTMWMNGDDVFFVNLNPAGDFNVSVLSNFQLQKVSTSNIDTFITSSVITDSLKLVGHGFSTAGRSFYVLTTYFEDGTNNVNPLSSLVLDTSTSTWGFWELMHTGIDDCPIVGWTRSTATRAGDGILSNGDIITVSDDKNPQDSTEAQIYVDTDYVDAGYISDTGSSGVNIEMILIPGPQDFGIREYKHADNLRLVAIPESTTQNMFVQWSDEGNDNYNTGRNLDLSNHNNKLTRLG